MNRRIAIRWAAAVLAAAALTGCGDSRQKTAVVRGKVTYKGKPVPHGSVTFMPTGSSPAATGEIQSDGKYTLTTYSSGDGAVLGSHKVMIVSIQDTSAKLPEERNPLPPPLVPDKYTNPATTPLTAEVKDQENTIDFELTGELGNKKP